MTSAKIITVKCPECKSSNIRQGQKKDDNVILYTCRSCGLSFEMKVEELERG